MTEDELRDKSYEAATGAFLTEVLTFEEYDNITEEDFEKLVWEPIERYGASGVSSLVENLADHIRDVFSECLT